PEGRNATAERRHAHARRIGPERNREDDELAGLKGSGLGGDIDLAGALARIRAQLARRDAERALEDSEERYALALRGTNDGLWDWKVDTGAVYYSARWNALVGLPEEEKTGTLSLWESLIHPDDL